MVTGSSPVILAGTWKDSTVNTEYLQGESRVRGGGHTINMYEMEVLRALHFLSSLYGYRLLGISVIYLPIGRL